MSTMVFKEKELIELCKTDAELIRIAFEHGDDTIGILAVKNSIESFESFLRSKKTNLIALNMDIDYRTDIVNLLKYSISGVPDNVKSQIISELIIPSNK